MANAGIDPPYSLSVSHCSPMALKQELLSAGYDWEPACLKDTEQIFKKIIFNTNKTAFCQSDDVVRLQDFRGKSEVDLFFKASR